MPYVTSDNPSHNQTATPPAIGLKRKITAKAKVAISTIIIQIIEPGEEAIIVASHRELMATTIIQIPTIYINATVKAASGMEIIHTPAIISSMPRAMLQPQLDERPVAIHE